MLRTEAVRPVPGTVRVGRARDNERSRLEVGELPGPAKERDHAGQGRKIEHDMPERGVVPRPVDHEVTVQHAGTRIAGCRGIDDPRAELDRVEVRGRDRAELTGVAEVVLAVLRHMELSAPGRGTGVPR